MDLRKLKTLIDLVSESGVAELEITEGEDHVRIVNRGGPGSRSGCCSGRPANHHEPDGGHFLPCAVARRSAFH